MDTIFTQNISNSASTLVVDLGNPIEMMLK